MDKIKVLAIIGPTAVGKTEFAMNFCQEFGMEIISCDSRQVYKYLDIGTSKPTQNELQKVKHHLIDFLDPSEAYSIYNYVQDFEKCVKNLHLSQNQIVLCGGSGLYFKVLFEGMQVQGDSDPQKRNELFEICMRDGTSVLYDRLKRINPQRANQLHPNDAQRIIRALLISEDTQNSQFEKKVESKFASYIDFIPVVLNKERDLLYRDINRRVDNMIKSGLLEEIEMLRNKGCSIQSPGIRTVGYQELIECDLRDKKKVSQAIELIKQSTRQYAKRQVTWFKNQLNGSFFDYSLGYEKFSKFCRELLN